MFQMRELKTNSFLALLEFSFKSLSQAYGRVFMRHIVLRHPLRTLRALWTYCQVLTAGQREERLLFRGGEDEFVRRAAGNGGRLLVGTGFCQKPLHAVPRQRSRDASAAPPNPAQDMAGLRRRRDASAAGSGYDCPAGRFDHDCLYLSRLELDSRSEVQFHPACTDCSIRILGHAALRAGASFAVLTSALDIAHDILLPALEERRFTRVLFAICPYSVEPMSLALLISGVEGCIFHYHARACADYSQWLRADGGDKPERTVLSPQTLARLLGLLETVAARRCSRGNARPMRYQQVSHVFRPH